MECKPSHPANQAGFTLIEVMVSGALLSLAVVGASYEYVQEVKGKQSALNQAQGRQLLSELVQKAASNPDLFPNVVNGASNIIYMTCYTLDGSLGPSPTQSTGNLNPLTTFAGNITVPTPIGCGPSSIEIQVGRNPTGNNGTQVIVNSFVVGPTGSQAAANVLSAKVSGMAAPTITIAPSPNALQLTMGSSTPGCDTAVVAGGKSSSACLAALADCTAEGGTSYPAGVAPGSPNGCVATTVCCGF